MLLFQIWARVTAHEMNAWFLEVEFTFNSLLSFFRQQTIFQFFCVCTVMRKPKKIESIGFPLT